MVLHFILHLSVLEFVVKPLGDADSCAGLRQLLLGWLKGSGFCHLCPQWNLALQLVMSPSSSRWLKNHKTSENHRKPLFFGYLTMFDHVWPFCRGWGTHLDLFCGSCEDKPRNIFVHESHPLPRPQRMEAAPRGAWDWMDPPKKIQRVSNVSPKPNKTVENILNDGTICNYDFWNCVWMFLWFFQIFQILILSDYIQ